MKEESTGVSPVIATILLIAITVVAVGIVMAFVAGLGTPKVKPLAYFTAGDQPESDNKLYIKYESGDDLDWDDLQISVTENSNSATIFDDKDWDQISSACLLDGMWTGGESIVVSKGTDDVDLKNGYWYHIVIRHVPTGTSLFDTNVKVTSA